MTWLGLLGRMWPFPHSPFRKDSVMAFKTIAEFETKDADGNPVKGGTHHNGTKGIVCLESDLADYPMAIQELRSGAARNEAITVMAGLGLPDPRCEMSAHPYPITDKGGPVIDPRADRIAAYRIDIPLTRRLV